MESSLLRSLDTFEKYTKMFRKVTAKGSMMMRNHGLV
jgi:hypothetical protein